jgi:hypothetical protein
MSYSGFSAICIYGVNVTPAYLDQSASIKNTDDDHLFDHSLNNWIGQMTDNKVYKRTLLPKVACGCEKPSRSIDADDVRESEVTLTSRVQVYSPHGKYMRGKA